MAKKKATAFMLLSTIFIIGSIIIYFYFRTTLKLGVVTLPSTVTILSIVLIFIFIFVGIYHLYVLFQLLIRIPGKEGFLWLYSISFVLVTLSGITLLTDVTILSDIGKEYVYFNVSDEWNMVYFFTIFHLLTVVLSYFVITDDTTQKQSIMSSIRTGSDQLYRSLYQIILIAGTLGMVLSIFFLSGAIKNTVLQDYILSLALLFSGLIALPVLLFGGFWYLKFHKRPVIHWLDEHEWLLTIKGMSLSLVVGWIFMGSGVILSIVGINLSLVLWFILTVFLQLTILSISVLINSNIKTNEKAAND